MRKSLRLLVTKVYFKAKVERRSYTAVVRPAKEPFSRASAICKLDVLELDSFCIVDERHFKTERIA